MVDRGAEGVSFPPIVAAGAHGALPHAEPRDEAIPKGTLVVVDWGCVLDGYCSDCTRTFATGELKRRDGRGVRAGALRAGRGARRRARRRRLPRARRPRAGRIEEAGHGEHFGHGLGHGVGMEVHEGPRLSPLSDDRPLEAGNAVTVEPGVYVPGEFGVRIEDLVVVTDSGCEPLTGFTKELTSV